MSHVTIICSPCHMSQSPMSHVKFKKCPCGPVDFRGQGPCDYSPPACVEHWVCEGWRQQGADTGFRKGGEGYR